MASTLNPTGGTEDESARSANPGAILQGDGGRFEQNSATNTIRLLGVRVSTNSRESNSGTWSVSDQSDREFERSGSTVTKLQSHGHRTASWLVAAIFLGALSAAALCWSVVMPGRWLAMSITMVAVVFMVLLARGNFRVRMTSDLSTQLPSIAMSAASGATAAVLLTAMPVLGQPRAALLVSLLGCMMMAAIGAQVFSMYFVRLLWKRGLLRSSALVYGSDSLAREVAVEIDLRRDYGVDVAGFIGPKPPVGTSLPAPLFDHGDELLNTIQRTGADRLIMGPAPDGDDAESVRVARAAASHGLSVWVVPRFYEMGFGLDSMSPDRARGYPLVRMQRAAHPQFSIRLKRTLDISVSLLVLLLSSPLMLVVAAVVKLTSPGPVLFSQERIGRYGEPITVRKFRSMDTSATSDSEWTAQDRITWIGGWIRRLNIDELPQLYSVLQGEMSLVGPRPERPHFVERFEKEIPDYNDRHRMPVGMTGLAQVIGLRGDTSIAERVKYDNLYIDQWSFRSDLKIMAKTVIAIVRQGTYEQQAIELQEALDREPAKLRPPDQQTPSPILEITERSA